jgi:L-ascorbate metabolism protein UlaG (beta-lactamase superfamily)
MVITWYGQACFKIQSGQLTVAIDPFDKSIGLTPPKFEAQLVLVTHDHHDHNNTKDIKEDPFVIDGPGEYEYQGALVYGIAAYHDDKQGAQRGPNTLYVVQLEDIRVAHLGDLGQRKLTDEQVEALGSVDVLLIPVGGTYTVGGTQALEIVSQIEPKIVIPMHYKVKGLTITLEDASGFLKEIGQPDAAPQEKLTVKKKDLQQERTEVVVLKP